MSSRRQNFHKNTVYGPLYVASKREQAEYFTKKYSNDPRTVAAKKHMEHKAYGGKKPVKETNHKSNYDRYAQKNWCESKMQATI